MRDIVVWLFMKSIPIVSTHRGVVFCAVCWLMLKVGKIFPKRNAGHIIQPAVHGARRTARWLHNSRARCAGLRGAAVTLTQFFCRLAGGCWWLAGTTCSKLSQPGGVTSERSTASTPQLGQGVI